jgi:ribosomal protein S18 acetylase RimI-like enzyme
MIRPITPATPADAAAVSRLVNTAYRGDVSRQGWTTEADLLDGTRIDETAVLRLIQQPDTTVLLYRETSQLLGCVELRTDGGKLYLGMLSVRPDAQAKGIGKMLMAAAEAHARARGLNAIYMTVISVRQELIEWYVRLGYRLTGERKPFVVPDERWGIPKRELEFVVLEKTLA